VKEELINKRSSSVLLLSVKTNKIKHTKSDIVNMEHNRDTENLEFKEKIWGKTIDGEYVIDGYAFRGKKVFKRALEGIKVFMKKRCKEGSQQDKNNCS
jgi:hypothetical protein